MTLGENVRSRATCSTMGSLRLSSMKRVQGRSTITEVGCLPCLRTTCILGNVMGPCCSYSEIAQSDLFRLFIGGYILQTGQCATAAHRIDTHCFAVLYNLQRPTALSRF